MRKCSDFVKLKGAISKRIRRLRFLITQSQGFDFSTKDRAAAFVTIEADNAIVSGIREFLMSSALLKPKTLGGHRVSCSRSFASEPDVAYEILKAVAPQRARNATFPLARRDEQAVRSPGQVIRACNNLGVSNFLNAHTAASLNFSVFLNIKFYRHFFAHRNIDTFRVALNQSQSIVLYSMKFSHPSEFLFSIHPNSPSLQIECWLDEIETYFDFLLQ